MENQKKKLLSADGELMNALRITEDDLAANENGVLTPHQVATLRQGEAYNGYGSLLFGFIFGAIGVATLSVSVYSLFNPPIAWDEFTGVSVLGLIFSAIGFIALALRRVKRRNMDADIANNRLTTMQGIAVVTAGDNDTRGYLEVNEQRFNVSKDVLKRIQHLEPYLVHYLEESKVIISMQRLYTENDNIKDEVSNRLSDADDAVQYRSHPSDKEAL
ncbi:MAG: hypothetical protein ACFE0Q_07740 [Anaerolineae bacterium]